MVLLIKQKLEREERFSGNKSQKQAQFEDLSKFGVYETHCEKDSNHAQSLKLATKFVSMPMRRRKVTMVEKKMNLPK
jgi:hypothetical protein